MLIYTPTATRLPMPKNLFFAPTLNTPGKKKKKLKTFGVMPMYTQEPEWKNK